MPHTTCPSDRSFRPTDGAAAEPAVRRRAASAKQLAFFSVMIAAASLNSLYRRHSTLPAVSRCLAFGPGTMRLNDSCIFGFGFGYGYGFGECISCRRLTKRQMCSLTLELSCPRSRRLWPGGIK